MKSTVTRALMIAAAVVISLAFGLPAKTDTVIEGKSLNVPCDMKIVSIQWANKKPMVVLRPMREGEAAETWIVKPLDQIEGEAAGGLETTIVRECGAVYRK